MINLHPTRRTLFCAFVSCSFALGASHSLQAAAVVFTTAPDFLIESFDFDNGGDLYYLRTDFDFGAATPRSTQLLRRTRASGYSDPVSVFDFGARRFGSFVTVSGNRVYFGESSEGTIRSVGLDGNAPELHAIVPFNFDLAFSPGGEAFVSANTGGFGQGNEILHIDLSTGATQVVVTNTNDFSGPVAFDTMGNLFYGGAGSPFAVNPPTDIFRFSGAEISVALATMTPLDLSAAAPFASTPGNSHFAFAEGIGLFTHPPDGVAGGISLIDPVTGASVPVPGAPAPVLGSISHNGTALYGISTDFSASTSSFVLIPEPSRSALATFAFLTVLLRRRR